MVQYKVCRKRKESTSAVGSDMESFLTENELWSYDEDQAKLYPEKDAKEIAIDYLEYDTRKQFDFYIKSA